jgi:phosphohistidine phosphatase SixA
MNPPDDVSDYQPGDTNSDHAHYDDNNDGGKSLSTTGLESAEAEEKLMDKQMEINVEELKTKDTSGMSLGELLKGRNVFLIRHANTGKAFTDEKRQLTSLAEHQCSTFLDTYGTAMDRIKFCFSSPVERATSTASFLGFPDPTPIDMLYFKTYYTDEMQKLDDELGYAPLSTYLNYQDGHGDMIYASVRTKLVDDLTVSFRRALEKAKAVGEWEGDVMIVTHATTISLLAQAMLNEIAESSTSGMGNLKEQETKILSFNVGETEGFKISSDGTVEVLKNDLSDAPSGKNDDFVEKH